MVTTIDTVKLRSQEEMTIKVVRPPEESYQARLGQRYEHKGPTWRNDILRRLGGEFADSSLDTYFFGEVGDEIVGGMWTTVPKDTRDVGTLGHVFTPEEHRQKGICDFLMQVMTQTFSKEGGESMYLGTGNPVARRIYEKYGFYLYSSFDGTSGIFQWVVDGRPDFESRYFAAKGTPRVRDVQWGDLARFEALYNVTNGSLVRDHQLGVFQPAVYESQFLSVMRPVEEGNSICMVLANDDGHITGVARIVKPPATRFFDRYFERHVGSMEAFVHPNAISDAPRLIDALLKKAKEMDIKLLRATAASCDDSKIRLLTQSGFSFESRLRSQIRQDNELVDLVQLSYRVT